MEHSVSNVELFVKLGIGCERSTFARHGTCVYAASVFVNSVVCVDRAHMPGAAEPSHTLTLKTTHKTHTLANKHKQRATGFSRIACDYARRCPAGPWRARTRVLARRGNIAALLLLLVVVAGFARHGAWLHGDNIYVQHTHARVPTCARIYTQQHHY